MEKNTMTKTRQYLKPTLVATDFYQRMSSAKTLAHKFKAMKTQYQQLALKAKFLNRNQN
jgi:hypothetical protein